MSLKGGFFTKFPTLAQCAPCNMYYVRSMYSHFLLTMWYTTTSATLVQWWITWKVRIEGLYGAVHKRCFFRLHQLNYFFFYFTDKRNSTGNLYFEGGNSQDPGGLSTISNSLQQGSARILRGLSGSQPVGVRDSNSSLSSMNSDYDPNDPQAMFSRELRTAAGKLTFFFCNRVL